MANLPRKATMKGQRERERERENNNNCVVISKENNENLQSRLWELFKSACVGKHNQMY